MKTFSAIAVALVLLAPTHLIGQVKESAEENVLSYYAVDNSLDGQPLIDQNNLMRFYPVFAFRADIQRVHVNVYHGSDVFSRPADRMDNGRFWQVKLPEFELGEAIQRFEVELTISIDDDLKRQADRMQAALSQAEGSILGLVPVFNALNASRSALATEVNSLLARLKTINSTWESTSAPQAKVNSVNQVIEDLADKLTTLQTKLEDATDEVARLIGAGTPCDPTAVTTLQAEIVALETQLDEVRSLRDDIESRLGDVKQAYEDRLLDANAIAKVAAAVGGQDAQAQVVADYRAAVREWARQIDTLRSEIYERIRRELTDTAYIGPSIRKSDIILDDDLTSARILYRNYKHSLRRLPALDPAERLGIFRGRYVPFAVVGKRLLTPLDGSSYEPVFEIGLTFGDAIVSGDDFVVPEFSLRRLGVAFAITNRLFNSDAAVRALALTYDFNSYGSVAVGAHFGVGEKVEPYYSFGINKKAFEDLIGEIQRLFE